MKKHGLKPYCPQPKIEALLETVFKPLQFKPDVVKWMQDTLLAEHHEKTEDHKQQVASIRRRNEMLQTMINRAYEDKLTGVISEEAWKNNNAKWVLELELNKQKINALDGAKQDYIGKGVELIELVQDLESTYKKAPAEKKRRLVEIVSSNLILRNGSLEFCYKKPFDVLAESVEKKKWLGKLDEFRTWCRGLAA